MSTIQFLPTVSIMGLVGPAGIVDANMTASYIPCTALGDTEQHEAFHNLQRLPFYRVTGAPVHQGFKNYSASQQGRAARGLIDLSNRLFPPEAADHMSADEAMTLGVQTLLQGFREMEEGATIPIPTESQNMIFANDWHIRGRIFKALLGEELRLIALEALADQPRSAAAIPGITPKSLSQAIESSAEMQASIMLGGVRHFHVLLLGSPGNYELHFTGGGCKASRAVIEERLTLLHERVLPTLLTLVGDWPIFMHYARLIIDDHMLACKMDLIPDGEDILDGEYIGRTSGGGIHSVSIRSGREIDFGPFKPDTFDIDSSDTVDGNWLRHLTYVLGAPNEPAYRPSEPIERFEELRERLERKTIVAGGNAVHLVRNVEDSKGRVVGMILDIITDGARNRVEIRDRLYK